MKAGAVKRLKKRMGKTAADCESALLKARFRVAGEIRRVAKDPRIATNAEVRNRLFRSLNQYYALFASTVDDEISKAVKQVAKEAGYAAQEDSGSKANIKFDKKRFDDYMALISPGNGEYLAGTYAGKHASDTIRGLRQSLIETVRAAQVEQWTAQEIHKNLQRRWDEVSGNLEDHRFLDASGKKWSNSHYLNMLTRTTLQRVSRESYMDTLASTGDDLARIKGHGDNCKICARWDGKIISISGQDKRFPSYQDALDDGIFHPNCDCTLDAVIEGVDDAAISEQAGRR